MMFKLLCLTAANTQVGRSQAPASSAVRLEIVLSQYVFIIPGKQQIFKQQTKIRHIEDSAHCVRKHEPVFHSRTG